MSLFTAIIVYLMIFWTALFCILPWGNKRHETEDEGLAGSAPANPRIKQKFIITAFVSFVVLAIVYVLVEVQLIDFRSIALEMTREDGRL